MTPVIGGGALPDRLRCAAYGAARALLERGGTEGTWVAIDSPDVLPWLLGADLLGAAALVVEPTWTHRERAAVFHDAGPDLVVTGSPPAGGTEVAARGDESALFYLATTSGSSGTPKVIARTRASWLRSFEALGSLPGPVLIPGPLSSSLFTFGALHALWCGQRPLLRAGLAEIPDAGTVHVVPAMLPALLQSAPAGLHTVVCGGAHLDAALRERFGAVLPGVRLIEYYGSAEHSLIAVDRDGTGLRPVPGVELDDRDGTLRVRSPLASSGYLRAGRLEPASEWSGVGDRAELDGGVLTVHGRGSACISSGGSLIAAEEVESVLRGVPGVGEVLVAGTPHPRLGAVVTAIVEAREPPPLRTLRAAARAGLEPAKRPRRWLVTDTLPRTASGKPARAELTSRLADGTLRAEPMR